MSKQEIITERLQDELDEYFQIGKEIEELFVDRDGYRARFVHLAKYGRKLEVIGYGEHHLIALIEWANHSPEFDVNEMREDCIKNLTKARGGIETEFWAGIIKKFSHLA